MSTKAVTIVLHLDVPDDYTDEDLKQIGREIVITINHWPTKEAVVDWEIV